MILTVAIPTYNRAEKVKLALQKLIPQLTEHVCIIILDNCSEINVKNYLEPQIEGLGSLPVKIYRNKVNVGPDANFARCFEYSETAFTWVLSDDDDIAADAVSKILSDIEFYKDFDLIGFNFNSNCNLVTRDKPIVVNGTESLIKGMDFFGNWLFISTSVYHTKTYLHYIRYAYWSAYSMASQLSPALVAISDNKTFVFSEKYIVTNIPLDDVEQKWSNLKITLTLTSLLELPLKLKQNEHILLGRHLNTLFVSFQYVLVSILKSVKMNFDLIDEQHIYIARQIYSRTIDFRNNKIKERLLYSALILLLKNKKMLSVACKTPYVKKLLINKEIASFSLFRR